MAQNSATKTQRATGTYGIASWDEKTWEGKDHKDQPGAKLTHAKIVENFYGDFEGKADIQLVMAYRENGTAIFVGLQRMNGRIGERVGTFNIKVDGSFENGVATSTWEIISDSGMGDFTGIRGEGKTDARHGDKQPFTLDYYFE